MDAHPAPTDEVADLRARLGAALERIDALEAAAGPTASLDRPTEPAPAAVADDHDPTADGPSGIGRRRAFALLAGGAAAAAGAALLGAEPAAATNGDPLILGSTANAAASKTAVQSGANGMPYGLAYFDGVAPTTPPIQSAALVASAVGNAFTHGIHAIARNDAIGLRVDGVNGPGIKVAMTQGIGVDADGGSAIGVRGTSTSAPGVSGVSTQYHGVSGTSTTRNGVYGYSLDTGNGVRGEAAAAAAFGVYGSNPAGVGVRGESTSKDGVSGASTDARGVSGISQNKTGVYGETTAYRGVEGFASQAGVGVYGSSGGFGTGVHGVSNNGTGVQGDSADHAGVSASSATSIGLVASSGTNGGAAISGATYDLVLQAFGRQAPTADAFAHAAGELLTDNDGNLWYCAAAGTTGSTSKFRKVGGPATAGQLHVLPVPVRVYDSRPGTAPSTGPKTPLASNVARTIDLKGNNSKVPAGATAALVTVLLLGSAAGNGNFTLWAGGAAKPSANTMVWGGAAGGRYTAKELTALDANAMVQVSSSLKADIALDVVAYYR